MQRFYSPNPDSATAKAIMLSLIFTVAVAGQQSGGSEVPTTANGSSADSAVGHGDLSMRFVAVNSADHSPAVRLPITLAPGTDRLSLAPGQDLSASVSTLMLPGPKSLSASGRGETAGPVQALVTTSASLGVVLGLFLLLVWFQRRVAGRNGSVLPGEVVQTLGRVPLNGRQEMHLVKVGNKLLLLAVTATSAETLTEITDPNEIDRLSGICRHDQPGSISASFREILSQLQQPASPSLVR